MKPYSFAIQASAATLFSLVLPWRFAWSSIALILLVLSFAFSGNFKVKLRELRINPVWWLTCLVFIGFVISAFLSENHLLAFTRVERKLALLAIPVVVFSQPQFFHKVRVEWLTRVFVLSISAFLCWLFLLALYSYVETGKWPTYHNYSNLLRFHAVYLSFYTAMAISWVYSRILIGWKNWKNSLRVFYILWMLFLALTLLNLASKTILVTVLVLAAIATFSRAKEQLGWLKSMVFSFLLMIGALAFLLLGTSAGERFKTEWNADLSVVNQEKFSYDTPFTGTTIRLTIWKTAIDLLNKNNAWFMGLNPGDSQKRLNNAYQEKGIYSGNPDLGDQGYQGYNLHNQYLQTLIDSGVLTSVLLIAWVFTWLVAAFKSQQPVFIAVAVLFLMFSLTESMLESQRGLFPLLWFGCMYYLIRRPSFTRNV